ncbi:hypothetical protein MLD38_040368 [Melastoma candidum]|uniref:Uncharacterized protein n=1 Tax=Melastoma candidum TaxID=119954 RepID=A0ACB9L6J8_9MYRT|nr:hypothetical protein MLD38_040368 [Melastoma candidum]
MESMKKSSSSSSSPDVHLKRLEFARLAATRAVVSAAYLYNFAIRNCGPLKSTATTVEGFLTTLLRPVHDRAKGWPLDVLVFLDDKVDQAAQKFDEHAPPVAKKFAYQTWELIRKTSEKAHVLVQEAQTGGPHAAIRYAFAESKQVVLSQSVNAWVKLNEVPSLHMVADVATLSAAHWTKKYNDAVSRIQERGYPLSSHFPLVPVDEIAKAFKSAEKKKVEMEALRSESG